MFLKFDNKMTGIIVAIMIIKPPIVGVPVFSFCSIKPKSLTVSPICFFLRKFIIFFPYFIESVNEKTKANADLNDMYWNKLAPGNWYFNSKYSNKKYNISIFVFQSGHIIITGAKNITNIYESLLANVCAAFSVYHGPEGIYAIAKNIHKKTKILASSIKSKFEISSDEFFDTIVIHTKNMSNRYFFKALNESINIR